MDITLDELAPYIRKNLPQSKSIKHLVVDDKAKIVIFEWQSRRFAVKPTLQTFELKGNRLFITGASSLLQMILATKTRNQTIIGEIVETLDEINGMFNSQQDNAMKLLQTVKATLARLAGCKSVKKKAVTA